MEWFIESIKRRAKPVVDMYVGKKAVEMREASMEAAKKGCC